MNATKARAPLGVVLLGLGAYSSESLAPGLMRTQHCRLTGIVTGTPSKIPSWQKRYDIADKNVYSYETMDALFDNPDIDVVYVVTPNHTHARFAIAAARAKKHVWLEKPMAMNVQECQSIIDSCKQYGVGLSIGYRMHHEPNTQIIMNYAEKRPFGPIREMFIQAGFAGFSEGEAHLWRLKKDMGGGALYDMGVYCINAARYATGEEPTRVKAAHHWTDRPQLFHEVDEWTEFDLDFPSGAVAHCRTSFGADINLLRVLCQSGNYELAPMQENQTQGQTSDGTRFSQTVEHLQAKQMDDDALALIEGRDVLVPGEEGLRDLRVVEAVQRALSLGKAVEV